jgi:hypothetical protein
MFENEVPGKYFNLRIMMEGGHLGHYINSYLVIYVRLVKSRMTRYAGHETRIAERRNGNFVVKPP